MKAIFEKMEMTVIEFIDGDLLITQLHDNGAAADCIRIPEYAVDQFVETLKGIERE